MKEQKYWVKLKNEVQFYSSFDGFESLQFEHFWLSESGLFVPLTDRGEFTKSELAKLEDGSFYHLSSEKCDYCRYSGGDKCGDENCEEWINPLIELIPC